MAAPPRVVLSQRGDRVSDDRHIQPDIVQLCAESRQALWLDVATGPFHCCVSSILKPTRGQCEQLTREFYAFLVTQPHGHTKRRTAWQVQCQLFGAVRPTSRTKR